jgi:hypothetical protein
VNQSDTLAWAQLLPCLAAGACMDLGGCVVVRVCVVLWGNRVCVCASGPRCVARSLSVGGLLGVRVCSMLHRAAGLARLVPATRSGRTDCATRALTWRRGGGLEDATRVHTYVDSVPRDWAAGGPGVVCAERVRAPRLQGSCVEARTDGRLWSTALPGLLVVAWCLCGWMDGWVVVCRARSRGLIPCMLGWRSGTKETSLLNDDSVVSEQCLPRPQCASMHRFV